MTETEVLFTRMLHCDRVSLYLDKERRLTGEQSFFVAQSLKRRAAGEPLEYILGTCEFLGNEFFVDHRVLIPRPETEIVVETAIRYARSGYSVPKNNVTILDIGTGSGNIAVSLALFLPDARVIAFDISTDALSVARINATTHGCSDRIKFVCSDVQSDCGFLPAGCDMVVSNPPYVISSDIESLQPEVRREPREALDGGEDGLMFYRTIAPQALRSVRVGGFAIVEIGYGQCEQVCGIFQGYGFLFCEVVKDYNGIERVIVFKKL
jgi:release factor glutamine methyltransferase